MAGENVKQVKIDKAVCVAMITTAHGVKGQVKVKSYTKNPEDFAKYGALSDGKKTFSVKVVGKIGDQFLVQLDTVKDRTAAEAMRGVKLYVDRSVLPELADGEFYYTDLIGLTAKTTDGKILGTVKAIHNFGAGDMLEIGESVEFLSFTNETVPEIDLEHKILIVSLPDYVEVKTAEKGNE